VWQKGAQQASPEQRRGLANDPRNLQAVDGPTNSKGPIPMPVVAAAEQGISMRLRLDVKALYRLWVTRAEKDAMIRVLHSC
jgi:hypothetical protein